MLWSHPDEFFRKMPKTVVQSNWYYGESFELNPPGGKTNTYVKAYLDLEEHGYDQIPTGSYHADNAKSIGNTVQFCKKNITSGHLMGFMQSFWKPTIEENRERILKGIDLLGAAKAGYKRMR